MLINGKEYDIQPYSDLRGANLSGTDLSYQCLWACDLRDANMQIADCSFCDLEGSDLRGADLWQCKFFGSNLRGAKGIIFIQSRYPYQSYGYRHNGINRVVLGSDDRSVDHWDKDFNNNPEEFPEGSPAYKHRLAIYNIIKTWLINNYED